MTGGQALHHSTGRRVLVVDPDCIRRGALVRRSAGLAVAEAASLCEAFPIAEQMEPQVIALSSEFAVEPDVCGMIRLAGLTGCAVFFFCEEGVPVKRLPAADHVPCVALHDADDLGQVLARFSDPAAHLQPAGHGGAVPDLILIGASTGGIAALEAVLAAFPADCPPTLVVQHIRDGFAGGLVRRLDSRIRPRVAEAVDGERLCRGMVYFGADSDRHLVVAGTTVRRCSLVEDGPRHGHRPSVDCLFESALPFASSVSAALLTGMGADGAAGLGQLRRAGAHTIAQSRESSVVWGMPRVAIEAGAAVEVLSPDRIGQALLVGSRDSRRPARRPA